jgi:ADP-ribose pyrophosphatase YjhB (NUDIX family)
MTYRNPLPVVVVMVPVCKEDDTWGVLAVRRGINPDKGKLAMVSGYIDDKEHWRDAAIRELKEETSLTSFTRDQLILVDVDSSSNMQHLLIFCRTRFGLLSSNIPSVKNDEVEELVAVYDPSELAWEAHQRAYEKM